MDFKVKPRAPATVSADDDGTLATKGYVDGKVKTDVPVGAKFTDTVYTHPASHPASMITGLPTSLPADGGNADTVGGFTVGVNVPADAVFTDTDTITTINGKTGAISKADIVALGVPAQDTVYTHPAGTNPHGTTKSDVGLGNVDNVKQATKVEFDEHLADLASQEVGKGASLIGVHDAEGLFTSTTVEGALKETFTLGNSRKTELVDTLLSLDESLPINHQSLWEDILLASENISTGKKWASGNTQSSSDRLDFVTVGTSTNSLGYIEIGGLDFLPDLILLRTEIPNQQTVFWGGRLFSSDRGITYGIAGYALTLPAYINFGGFLLPARWAANYTWIAYE